MIHALFGLILILAALYILVLLLSLYMGSYVTDRRSSKVLNTNFTRIEVDDEGILWIASRDSSYMIYKDIKTPLAKYYIHYCGAVPRWSKLHDKIEYYYSIAKEEG